MTASVPPLQPNKPPIWQRLLPAGVFVALTLIMFGDVLFKTQIVLGHASTDLMLQFLPWREFGFGELRKGHLALWNPHIFGGAPYFAGFQSALLYPPNWLHLFLPLTVAINWQIALHVFLAGFLMHIWCHYRGLSSGASILAGVMYMFSGPYFLHVYGGHLPHLCLMAWAPLLFCAIDGAMDTRGMKWPLVGMFAFVMILLAGHPQYVYYTGILASIYVLLNLLDILRPSDVRHFLAQQLGMRDVNDAEVAKFKTDAGRAGIALLRCALIVVGGAAIASVQLFSGLDANSESVRSGGTDYGFSAMFSLPPENLLTFVAPGFFGTLRTDLADVPRQYYGRCYLWEMSVFVSVSGLVLAVFGAIAGAAHARRYSLSMALIALLLALGSHTPLHRVLYHYLPLFGEFRGASKFSYLAVIFISMLAASGFDALLPMRAGRAPRGLLIGAGSLFVVLLIAGVSIRVSANSGKGGAWESGLRTTLESEMDRIGQGYGSEYEWLMQQPTKLADPKFFRDAGVVASNSLLLAALASGLTLAIILTMRFHRLIVYGLVVLASVEMFVFARPTRATMPGQVPFEPAWADAVRKIPDYFRVVVIHPAYQNYGMLLGFNCVWGYDPGVLRRYAEVMFASQGFKPDKVSQYLNITNDNCHGIFRMVRAGIVLTLDPQHPVMGLADPMRVANLVCDYAVISDQETMLRTLQSSAFIPTLKVLLESEPAIRPAGASDPGSVRVINQTTDSLEVEADVKSPAILLITNNYSRGWRVVPIESTAQQQYQIMPANWTLQAIPLSAGNHHLRIEYAPAAFRIGAWISAISLIAYLAATALQLKSSPRPTVARS